MKTYLLGDDHVASYIRDFLHRLKQFEIQPTVWCPITTSGVEILKLIVEVLKEQESNLLDTVDLLPINVDDDHKTIVKDPNAKSVIEGKAVLLIDGAVHSGEMMRDCAEAILQHGPAELMAYSLVVKRGSAFMPTLWGLMMDETDRAYFMLKHIPNNRLNAGGKRQQPPVLLRLLRQSHQSHAPLTCGVRSIDRITWSDRFFQMKITNFETCTYLLCRATQTVGFLTLQPFEDRKLLVSEVAVDKHLSGKGYGGVLMRFADTLARQTDCSLVRLYAIKNKIEFYEGFGYRRVDSKPIPLDDEEYHLMEHSILYHDGPWR